MNIANSESAPGLRIGYGTQDGKSDITAIEEIKGARPNA